MTLRVLHGPVNNGNQAWSLSRAERQVGLASDLVVASASWAGYRADRVLGGRLSRVLFGLSAPFRYDALHFYYGRLFAAPERWLAAGGIRSMVATLEVRLAKLLGRRTVMTLQGCDVRIASRSQARDPATMCAQGRCAFFAACVSTTDRQRLGMIRHLLPLMDHVYYLNPELGHEVPGAAFMPYASVDIHAIVPEPPRAEGRPLIVHAPSDPAIKGTADILAALERLRDRFDFDVEIVTGVSHEAAMAAYRRADLAIDQIHAGWYGGFAVELMAMGKPVASYIRNRDMTFVPRDMEAALPVYRIAPDTLEADLAAILADRASWGERGLASRRFVEAWHDPLRIAAQLANVYEPRGLPAAARQAGQGA